MDVVELRNLDQARQYLLQGLLLQRVSAPTAGTVRDALIWAQEIAAAGDPLPPIGFVADLGQTIFYPDRTGRSGRELAVPAGLPPGLMRLYEDLVLGKFYADWAFERAGDALRRYQGRDAARGLAFVVRQFRDQAQLGGVLLAPALFRGLLEWAPEEIVPRAWDALDDAGLMPLLLHQYESLIAAVRRCPDVLTAHDVFELEKGTALAELGQRVALRQVLETAQRFQRQLPAQKLRPLSGRQEVPTRVLDEDTYPVGGYSSISTRGSIESLLHSQLAYMELRERPDLFDVKFVRDELFYYSRDENQFLRRRRTFVFVLAPDLAQARFKDAELPVQRIILVLALVVMAIRKLTEWLGEDALRFEVLFPAADGQQPLRQEQDLLKTILNDDVANGTVGIQEIDRLESADPFCSRKASRSLCHCLMLSVADRTVNAEDTVLTRLQIDRATPALGLRELAPARPEADDAFDGWAVVLEKLLQLWV